MKKEIKKSAPKAVKSEMGCGGNCTCAKHCSVGKILLKVVIVMVIFGAGFCAGKHMNKQHAPKPMVVAFDSNGCRDMVRVKCPKNAELLKNSASNADSCITIAELE